VTRCESCEGRAYEENGPLVRKCEECDGQGFIETPDEYRQRLLEEKSDLKRDLRKDQE